MQMREKRGGWLSLLAALVLVATGCTEPGSTSEKGATGGEGAYPPAVRALVDRGLEIVNEFEAPGGLTGYAARSGGRKAIFYATPDGRHVLLGTLLDADGKNLTTHHLADFMPERDYSEAWAKLERARWVAVGAEAPERVVYTFVDPNCPYCNKLWRATEPRFGDGLQVRYLLVAMLRPSSMAKSAAILQADDPTAAYRRHESRFGQGGIEPAETSEPEVKEAIRANTTLMQKLGISGTPAIVYRTGDGKVHVANGMPKAEKLAGIYGVSGSPDKAE